MADLSALPALLAARDWPRAEALLRRAARGRRPAPEVFYNLAKVLEAAGKPGQRRAWLKRAVAARADYAIAWFELGRAALEDGDLGAAYDAFGRARALDPTDAEARLNAARLALRLGRWAEAEGLWSGIDVPEGDIARYRIAAETGAPDAGDRLSALLGDPGLRPQAIRAMTRTARGRIPLRLPSAAP